MLETSTDFVAIAREHMSPVLSRYFELPFARGDGHYLFGPDGTRYLDFACGIATTSLGHRHPAVTEAIREQADRLLHLCNAVGYVEPTARLAAEIAAVMPDPLDTVFFGNSGSEAIEGAVKLAKRVTGRPAIIGFTGAFHGRTATAIALTTSSINYRVGYEPMLPSVYHAPFPDTYRDGGEDSATHKALAGLDDLFATLVPPSAVAAIVIEPFQGEGGYRPAPDAFLRELRRICTEHGIMFVADEIQAGYARTGKMWSFEHAGIVPDIVCLAKAIANGLPLGAIVTSRELQSKWGAAAHGTTFGGNPVSCNAGLAVLRTIREQNLVENSAVRGDELRAGLERLAAEDPGIGDVRGRGLMIGVEFVKDRATKVPDGERAERLMARCADLGLIVLVCGIHHQVMRWIPPLDVTSDEIAEALRIFGRALAEECARA